MKKYKLKKDFLYLQAGKIVDIEKKKDKNNVTRYIISIEDWIISEIVDSTHFVFEEYFEEISKNIFDLQRWDGYYYLFSDWDIGSCDYYWDEVYKDMVENWNAFLTKEEAEKESERRKAIQRIKKYCWENDIDIDYDEEYNSRLFYIEVDWEFEGQINFDSFPPLYSPIWYFSRDNAEKILEKFEKELRIILDV